MLYRGCDENQSFYLDKNSGSHSELRITVQFTTQPEQNGEFSVLEYYLKSIPAGSQVQVILLVDPLYVGYQSSFASDYDWALVA